MISPCPACSPSNAAPWLLALRVNWLLNRVVLPRLPWRFPQRFKPLHRIVAQLADDQRLLAWCQPISNSQRRPWATFFRYVSSLAILSKPSTPF